MSRMPLRVLLVDDHEVVRSGIAAMLKATEGIVVTGEAGTVREAIEEAERTRPDIVVMDVRLADGSGIEATREIKSRRPQTQVLMLTSFADDEALFASIMAGASGYVLKQVKGGELVRAIRAVGQGESLLDPAVTKSVLDRLRKGKHLSGGADPPARGRRQDEQGDRKRFGSRREDRKELRLEHPFQTRSGPARGGSCLPSAPHHHARHLSPPLGCRSRGEDPLAPRPQGTGKIFGPYGPPFIESFGTWPLRWPPIQ